MDDEEAGAAVLARFFPTLVTDCVRYHGAAKRYLCATKPAYFAPMVPRVVDAHCGVATTA